LAAVVRASGSALAPPTPAVLLHPLKAVARLRLHSDARVSAGVIGMYVAAARARGALAGRASVPAATTRAAGLSGNPRLR
jgi:hypothetical protein